MTYPRWVFRSLLVLLAFGAPVLRAQHALFVEHKGEFRLVRRAVRNDPYVDNGNGKLVSSSTNKVALVPAKRYAPFYVSVRRLKVTFRHLEMINSGAQLNREFLFRADFESPYPLKNVFVVLDMDSSQAGKMIFLHEVGDLEPRVLKPVDIGMRIGLPVGDGKYKLYVFSDGVEVFHSEMPFSYIERKLDDIVRDEIKDVTDAGPRPFVGPAPEYPAALEKAKVSGRAVVKFTIKPNGRVLNPEVTSATNPALGEAALVAARQWRFLPRVKAGKPVETAVEMPFVFGPAGATGDDTAAK